MFWKGKDKTATHDYLVPGAAPEEAEAVIPAEYDAPEIDHDDRHQVVSAAVPDREQDEDEGEQEGEFQRLKSEIHRQVIGKIDLSSIGTMDESDLRIEIRRAAQLLIAERAELLNNAEKERLIAEVINETFGLGPLEPLFRDPSISDIMINGANTVYIERNGRLERSKIKFANDSHLLKIIQRIVSGVGRRIDETSPMVDARLARRQPSQCDHSAAGH